MSKSDLRWAAASAAAAVRGRTRQRVGQLMPSISTGQILQWLGVLSIVTFVGSLLIVPWLILLMSPYYFIRHRLEVIERHRRHPVLTMFFFILRNTVGLCLLGAGTVMLVMPGQGILTMLIGFSFMDFPGKHKFLEKAVQSKRLQRSLNWIRRKGGKEDFVFATEQVES